MSWAPFAYSIFSTFRWTLRKCCMWLGLRTYQGMITFMYTYTLYNIFILIYMYIQYCYNTKLLKNISVHPLFDRIKRTLVSLGWCQYVNLNTISCCSLNRIQSVSSWDLHFSPARVQHKLLCSITQHNNRIGCNTALQLVKAVGIVRPTFEVLSASSFSCPVSTLHVPTLTLWFCFAILLQTLIDGQQCFRLEHCTALLAFYLTLSRIQTQNVPP